MSSEIEFVPPTTVDGLEFYVSLDGTKAGMSQGALSRLCGVNMSSMFDEGKLIWKLAQTDDPAKPAPECLKAFQGKVFETQLKGKSRYGEANIINYEACAAIVQYYATESKAANNIARHSLGKFASIGMMTWIKQVTGFESGKKEEVTNAQLLSALQALMGEVQSMKMESREYKAIRHTTVDVFPRLDEMLVDIAQQDEQLPASHAEEEELVTLVDWLAAKGITLDRSQMHSFASLVAQTYRTMTGRDPATLLCENKRGYKTIKRNAYKACEYPVLDIALKKLF